MAAKNVILRKKISNVVYDLYPKSIADQIVVGINNETEESLATRLVSLASDIASKVPEQLSQNQTFTQWKASVDAALQSDNINFDTLQEIVDWVEGHEDLYQTLITAFNTTKSLAEANETAIGVLNGDVNTAGSVAKAVNDAVSPVSAKANANEAAITVLNGNNTTAGSVAKAVKDAVDPVSAKADANEDAIEVLNGDDTTAGSVDKKIKDAVDPVSAKANANETAIGVLNGDNTTAGSVAKAVKDAVDPVSAKANANETAIGVLNGDANTAGSVAKAISDAVADMQANVDNKGAVYASATQPAEFGEYDLWVYLQN